MTQRAAYRTAISAAHILVKYADDVDLLDPETSDVDIVTEFNSVKEWVTQNKWFPVNSYPNQVVPCQLVPKPTRT